MEKEVSEAERRLLVRRKYLDKIGSSVRRDFVDQRELYSLVRGFFSEFLKLEYQFTYEELSTELNKIFIKPSSKKDIDDFLYSLSESEYFLDKDLEQAEVKDFLQRLFSIVQILIYDNDIESKAISFFDKIFKKQKPYDSSFAQSGNISSNQIPDAEASNVVGQIPDLPTNLVGQNFNNLPPLVSQSPGEFSIKPMDKNYQPFDQSLANGQSFSSQNQLSDQLNEQLNTSNQNPILSKNQGNSYVTNTKSGPVLNAAAIDKAIGNRFDVLEKNIEMKQKMFDGTGPEDKMSQGANKNGTFKDDYKRDDKKRNVAEQFNDSQLRTQLNSQPEATSSTNQSKQIFETEVPMPNYDPYPLKKKGNKLSDEMFEDPTMPPAYPFSHQNQQLPTETILKEDSSRINKSDSSNQNISSNENTSYNMDYETRKNIFIAENPDIMMNEPLMIEDNNPLLVKIHELMEDSYVNIDSNKIDLAKKNYLLALDSYHTLSVIDKRLVFLKLYDLFKRLHTL